MIVKSLTPQALASFRAYLQRAEKSAATIEKYLCAAKRLAAALGGAPLTREAVLEYKRTLVARGYAVRSINATVVSLNRLFAFLERPDCRLKTLKLQRQLYCSEEKELNKEEYRRLCAAARGKSERLLLILQTLCGAGLRVSELRFVTVEAVRRGEAVVSLKGKTRRVFLVRALQRALLRYLSKHSLRTGPIFLARSGGPIDRTSVWREMKSLCTEAHVNPQKVFPHNLRRLFARVFYRQEKDLAKLADLLGHSSIDTTRLYIISTGAEHRRRMERMRLIE